MRKTEANNVKNLEYVSKILSRNFTEFFTGTLDSTIYWLIFIIIIIIYIYIYDAIISISLYSLYYLYKSFTNSFSFFFLLKIYFSATLLYLAKCFLKPRFDVGFFSICENRLKSNARVVEFGLWTKSCVFSKFKRKKRIKFIYIFLYDCLTIH